VEQSFWQEKWQQNEIGFHLPQPHPLLQRFLPELDLEEGTTLLLPLCGKTLDIPWLLSQEFRVVGVELSELAVTQLFQEMGVTPQTRPWRGGIRYSAPNLVVYQGDFFELLSTDLGTVDAIYDRAALVALPMEMRARYAARLVELTFAAPQLLISFEYDQLKMDGPPFSVVTDEIGRLYGDLYEMRELSRTDIIDKADRFRERGLDSFVEIAWHLTTASTADERLG
jgi:thiopurine S-methyltransferase